MLLIKVVIIAQQSQLLRISSFGELVIIHVISYFLESDSESLRKQRHIYIDNDLLNRRVIFLIRHRRILISLISYGLR